MDAASLSKVLSSGPALLRARWHLRSAARLGSGIRLWGQPAIHNYGTLVIGDRVRLMSHVARIELAVGKGGLLEIGDNVYINYGCSIGATELIRIGSNCSIGSHTIIMDNDFHELDPERRNQVPASAPIVLEENVWLGVRVTILKGVTIGTGSVIGAGSVVTRDVPPRSLAAGVPAKVLRSI